MFRKHYRQCQAKVWMMGDGIGLAVLMLEDDLEANSFA